MPGIRQLIIATITLLIMGSATAGEFEAGLDYQRISPPVPTQNPAKVEVVELFWYGCPHCFHFEPRLEKWLKHKPANVDFIRVPATFNSLWKLHARAYYTAEILGVLDKIHLPLFEAIHLKREKIFTEDKIRDFFIKQGVKPQDFDDTFHSFAVETKLNRAEDLVKRYGIDSVPTMVVNGKYRTSGPVTTGSARNQQQGMLEVVDYLIKKESR